MLPVIKPNHSFVYELYEGTDNITTIEVNTEWWINRVDKACKFQECRLTINESASKDDNSFELVPKTNYIYDLKIDTSRLFVK